MNGVFLYCGIPPPFGRLHYVASYTFFLIVLNTEFLHACRLPMFMTPGIHGSQCSRLSICRWLATFMVADAHNPRLRQNKCSPTAQPISLEFIRICYRIGARNVELRPSPPLDASWFDRLAGFRSPGRERGVRRPGRGKPVALLACPALPTPDWMTQYPGRLMVATTVSRGSSSSPLKTLASCDGRSRLTLLQTHSLLDTSQRRQPTS